MTDHVENLVLVHLKAMREENVAYRGQMVAGLDHIRHALSIMERVNDRLDALDQRLASMDKRLGAVSSDIIHLENQNLSRHGETLTLSRDLKGSVERSNEATAAVHDVLDALLQTLSGAGQPAGSPTNDPSAFGPAQDPFGRIRQLMRRTPASN